MLPGALSWEWSVGTLVGYFLLVYVLGFFLASFTDTTIIWSLSYITIALMAIPNLVGILVLHKDTGEIEHKIFYQIIDYLEPGDGLVINQTKIFPARLFGNLDKTSSKIEILLLREVKDDEWEVLVKPGRKAKIGRRIVFNQGKLSCEILDHAPSGGRVARFSYQGDFFDIICHPISKGSRSLRIRRITRRFMPKTEVRLLVRPRDFISPRTF